MSISDSAEVVPTVTESAPAQAVSAANALEELKAEIDAVPSEEVMRIVADITRASGTCRGAVPKIVKLRSLILKEMPSFPIEKLDKLDKYALAALGAHMAASPSGAAASTVGPLLDEAGPLRQKIFVSADALAEFGIIEATRVARLKSGNGAQDTAEDLMAGAAMILEVWDVAQNKVPISKQQLLRAQELGTDIIFKLGVRNQPEGEPVVSAAAAIRRAKAYTLFVNAYDACQRAVSFLRWDEGDAEQIAPSLFSRASRRKARDAAIDPESPEGPVPAGNSTAAGVAAAAVNPTP